MKVTLLGCGGSAGVPTVTNNWGACDPAEPRNFRTRPSILIETSDKKILVDAGPDLRMQMLSSNVSHIDAVIFTHEHSDHTHGIDELRIYALTAGRSLDVYGSSATLDILKMRFDYMFRSLNHDYKMPLLTAHNIEPGDDIPALGMQTFAQDHHRWVSLGLRCGKFAYSTDVTDIEDEGFTKLAGIDSWIVAALQREPHHAHASLDTVLSWISRVAPRRAILTHMNNTMDYQTLRSELPATVEPGYDGMVINLED